MVSLRVILRVWAVNSALTIELMVGLCTKTGAYLKPELTWLNDELGVEAEDGKSDESERQTGPPAANGRLSDVIGAAALGLLLGMCLAGAGAFKSRTTSG